MPRNRNKSAEQKIQETLKKHLKGGETVLIGVSGGPDSVFLLHMLSQFKPKLNIIVAHVNHALRGINADIDTEFVKELSQKLEAEFHSTKIDIMALAKNKKRSVEETGRNIRYNFFKKLYKTKKASFVLTAHHADDNLETILLNLVRGTGLKGLTGIEELSQSESGTPLLRPLLNITKNEIIDYLTKNHLTYRSDQTNKDISIPRNFLRNTVIPELKTLNPSLTQTVQKNAQNLKKIQDHLDSIAEKHIKKANISKKSEDLNLFDLKKIQALSEVTQSSVLRLIYFKREGNTKNLEQVHIDEVLSIINKNVGRKQKKLGKYTVEIKAGTLIMNPCRS